MTVKDSAKATSPNVMCMTQPWTAKPQNEEQLSSRSRTEVPNGCTRGIFRPYGPIYHQSGLRKMLVVYPRGLGKTGSRGGTAFRIASRSSKLIVGVSQIQSEYFLLSSSKRRKLSSPERSFFSESLYESLRRELADCFRSSKCKKYDKQMRF